MTERQLMLASLRDAVRADLTDDAKRLAMSLEDQQFPYLTWADWMEEHSRDEEDHLRAELIRLACEKERLPPPELPTLYSVEITTRRENIDVTSIYSGGYRESVGVISGLSIHAGRDAIAATFGHDFKEWNTIIFMVRCGDATFGPLRVTEFHLGFPKSPVRLEAIATAMPLHPRAIEINNRRAKIASQFTHDRTSALGLVGFNFNSELTGIVNIRNTAAALTCSWDFWAKHADEIMDMQPVVRVALTADSRGLLPFALPEWPGVEFTRQVQLTSHARATPD